jgi:hypothetical protein
MPDEKKETYPVIPVTHWWSLRKRFQQSMPATVTPGFVAAALDMKEQSAQANIIPSLIMMGIVDQEGKPTERAIRWRDDHNYAEVCREIRDDLYPQELRDAVPGPDVDRPAAERWFAFRTGVGQRAAKRFALVYDLLTTAAIPETRGARKKPARRKAPTKREAETGVPLESAAAGAEVPLSTGMVPSIHINIQIHISPDAKPGQIDQIFASMAKHLGTSHD